MDSKKTPKSLWDALTAAVVLYAVVNFPVDSQVIFEICSFVHNLQGVLYGN